MFKNIAISSFILAIITYSLTIISPFFINANYIFMIFKLSFILFGIGVITGFVHVINEKKSEKKKEDWDKLKDY